MLKSAINFQMTDSGSTVDVSFIVFKNTSLTTIQIQQKCT